MSRLYCLSEDREREEVGLRIAVASLLRACLTARVVVHRPNPTANFRRWLGGFSQVELIAELPAGASSWNCKPHTLLPLLARGIDEVIWLDSDICVARDPSYLFDALAPDVLAGTEESPTSPDQGWAVRTGGWGLTPGRTSPITLNTCVVRVTQKHIPLLHRWKEMLADPEYMAAQLRPFDQRPPHYLSDQDLLNALLGSAEFAGIPVRYLRIGHEMIHCGGALGYSVSRRLSGVFQRIPPFLHAIAGKPWWVLDAEYRQLHGRWFTLFRRVLQETSPYVVEARRLRSEIGIPCPWLDKRSALGWALAAAGFGHFALRGLPFTALATLAKKTRVFR